MLSKAKEHKFQFDTVQMLLNVMDAHFRSFQANVLPVLVKQGIGVLGMKSMGSGVLIESKYCDPDRSHFDSTIQNPKWLGKPSSGF